MTSAEAHVNRITRDIGCPACGYNLRGLAGDIVTCPECGHRADRARLVSDRWTRPWYKAPGLNTVQWPAAALLLMFVAWFFAAMIVHEAILRPSVVIATVLSAAAVWSLLMSRAYRVFGSIEGLVIALLVHALVVAYFVVLGAVIGAILACIGDLMTGDAVGAMIALIIGAVAITLAIGLRWIERYIARRCIARYLRVRTAV